MEFTDAVKSYYDVMAEFKLIHKTKYREKYIVTFNTELYFFTTWFRKLVNVLRYNSCTNSVDIDHRLYPTTDWNIFTSEQYSDPNDCHENTLDQKTRCLIGSFVELMIKIEQTPPSHPDATYEYVINSNLKCLHQYLLLRDKYIQYLTDIRMYSLLRNKNISYVAQCFKKQIASANYNKDNTIIEIAITLSSNPLRRAMEYIDFNYTR
jgi:hypothetical protein